MLSKILNVIKAINKSIESTDDDIKIKKENFDKEWNKWGTKRMRVKKIP